MLEYVVTILVFSVLGTIAGGVIGAAFLGALTLPCRQECIDSASCVGFYLGAPVGLVMSIIMTNDMVNGACSPDWLTQFALNAITCVVFIGVCGLSGLFLGFAVFVILSICLLIFVSTWNAVGYLRSGCDTYYQGISTEDYMPNSEAEGFMCSCMMVCACMCALSAAICTAYIGFS